MTPFSLSQVTARVLHQIREAFPSTTLQELPEFAIKMERWAIDQVKEQVWRGIPELLEDGHQLTERHGVLCNKRHYVVDAGLDPVEPGTLHVVLIPRAEAEPVNGRRKRKNKTTSAKILNGVGMIRTVKFTAPVDLVLERETVLAAAVSIIETSNLWLIECYEAAVHKAADALAESLYAEMRLLLQKPDLFEKIWFWVVFGADVWYLPDPKVSSHALSTLGAKSFGTGDSPIRMLGMIMATEMKFVNSLSSGIAKEGKPVSVDLTSARYVKDLPVYARAEAGMFGVDLTIVPIEVEGSAKLFLGFPTSLNDVLLPKVSANIHRLKRVFATQRTIMRRFLNEAWDWMKRVEWIKGVERTMKIADWIRRIVFPSP